MNANWRELPAGLELDRVIAARLGWMDLEVRDEWSETAEDIYHTDRLFGLSTETPEKSYVPQYSTNADDALSLIGRSLMFAMWQGLDVWCATCDETCDLNVPIGGYYETGDTPALAICRAWLAHGA